MASRYKLFDRSEIRFKSVNERLSKLRIDEIAVVPYSKVKRSPIDYDIKKLAENIKKARFKNKPVILCMGAHPIKNGGCLLIKKLIDYGWITHVATNGAGAIHDWEFAKFGKSTECVKTNIAKGEFGIWQETAVFFGLAAQLANEEEKGWGEKIGELMWDNVTFCNGTYHFKDYSIMHYCYKRGIPFTIHPGIGQDIIYSHPYVDEDVGCAINDFLIFAESVRNIQNGVYLSVGSSVMSPMIFEKALSMSRNVQRGRGRGINQFVVAVNDLADANWDWSQGEPPQDNPAYYLRWMKTFHRMGPTPQYFGCHNIEFLNKLCWQL